MPGIPMSQFSQAEAACRQIERGIKALIEFIGRNEGGLFLCDRENPDFTVRITKPMSVSFFAKIDQERE